MISPTPNMIAEKVGPVGRLIFNKPQKHNATSTDMWEAIPVILDEFEKDPAIRVVVVTGAGDKAFVSGADISQFEKVRNNADAQGQYDKLTSAGRASQEISPLPSMWTLPSIAAAKLERDGKLSADIVWGGNYFGIVDLTGSGLRISPDNGTELSRMGLLVRDQLNSSQRIQHPTEAHINNLNFVTFWHEPTIEGAFYKNVHVFSAGQLDRSPGGTGT